VYRVNVTVFLALLAVASNLMAAETGDEKQAELTQEQIEEEIPQVEEPGFVPGSSL